MHRGRAISAEARTGVDGFGETPKRDESRAPVALPEGTDPSMLGPSSLIVNVSPSSARDRGHVCRPSSMPGGGGPDTALAVLFLVCFFPWFGWAAEPVTGSDVVLETTAFRYVIGSDGKNRAFVDRATGIDYLRPTPGSSCAHLRQNGKEFPATRVARVQDQLELSFEGTPVRVGLKAEVRPEGVVMRLESVSNGEVEALTFLNLPLTLKGQPGEPFGACAHALNLSTRVDALPALQSELRASCERATGLVGSRVALVAAPMGGMLPALRAMLEAASELPVCKVAGPWAHEVPFNHGSYLFNFGSLTETNVEDWIAMTRSLGFTQIDNHGGGEFFRFGDMELNRQKWPEGWEAWRRIVARLHAGGVDSIFHTYAFFIDKRSRYVTPVPDPRLDAFRTFTLAEPLTPDATEIVVQESTAGMTTITGFFEHNSVVLHLGEELVTFGGVSPQAPWRFTGVKRGALGTRAASHERGARARHLKECFGLFVPNPESSLFEEIAANHAEVVNRCGFDGLYLDAIDGSSILRGSDACWYWANKFVVEIQKRLARPVGMEMSAMWHQFWQYRTRWQAWDYPQRGHERFLDLHAESVGGGLLLPRHLGWWNFQVFNPPQIEPTYPEVMENVGAKLIGWDAGISLTGGVDREALRRVPLYRRATEVLRACEGLRHAGVFDEAVKKRLQASGEEFGLYRDASGRERFRPRQSQGHVVAMAEPWTRSWQVTNRFAGQPMQFRLEALMAAGGTTNLADPANVLGGLAEASGRAWKRTAATGVAVEYAPWTSAAAPGEGESGVSLTATNEGRVPQRAAWTRAERSFDPVLNLGDAQGLAMEVEGDGSGAWLAIRMESPRHLAFGAVADRYLPLDFVGRRVVTLVETESRRWNDFDWGDGKGLYNLYRETIDFKAVEAVSLWLQNLPPGRASRVVLHQVRAVPLRSAAVRNPVVVVDGARLEFPVELTSGSWIEAKGPDACEVFGPKGESQGRIVPRGDWPVWRGAATLQLEVASAAGPAPRAKVTVFSFGPGL